MSSGYGSEYVPTVFVKFMYTNCMVFSNSKYMFFQSYVHEGNAWMNHDNYRQKGNVQVTRLKMSPIYVVSQDIIMCVITQVVYNIFAIMDNTDTSPSILTFFNPWLGAQRKRVCRGF
jgi:hypothetical protein